MIAIETDFEDDYYVDCGEENCHCIFCEREREKKENEELFFRQTGYPANYWKYSQSQLYMCEHW